MVGFFLGGNFGYQVILIFAMSKLYDDKENKNGYYQEKKVTKVDKYLK
jgi:hypothetical protein